MSAAELRVYLAAFCVGLLAARVIAAAGELDHTDQHTDHAGEVTS